ncbi:MAG: hypothetical protein E7273_13115 [Pseudobutyrivibrio ruminis]|nr:hypothetical protein [Pseudobutyrivibrio ruminis]
MIIEAVPITNELKEAHEKRINEAVKRQNDRIIKARENGETCTIFYTDKYDQDYKEIRGIFEKAGYTIKPTGISGGVMQLTEDICW